MEDEREQLSEERENIRLEARSREADRARREANAARNDVDLARSQAEVARIEAKAARQQAETARMEAELTKQRAEDLQRQIAELNAKPTDRGLVVTLGDVLFETGKAELKGSATNNLGKLATFLNQYQDRSVIIEGHTDNIGSDDFNLGLSQRRAEAVRTFLITYGIDGDRITTLGKGEGSPVANNETAAGRQQNRRVEVIISNPTVSSRR